MMGAMKLQGPCQQALQVEARQRLDQAGSAIERGGWLTIRQWCFKDCVSVIFLLEHGGEKIGCSLYFDEYVFMTMDWKPPN